MKSGLDVSRVPRLRVRKRNVRGSCGFSFGNGCSEGTTETSLFGSEKRRTIPIKAEV